MKKRHSLAAPAGMRGRALLIWGTTLTATVSNTSGPQARTVRKTGNVMWGRLTEQGSGFNCQRPTLNGSQLETRNPELGTGTRNPELGTGTRNPELGTRNPNARDTASQHRSNRHAK